MRSLLAGAAAVWFIYQAFTFLPIPFVTLNDGQIGGVDGDPGAVAITWAARTLFAGLVLISLALVDWAGFVALFRNRRPSD